LARRRLRCLAAATAFAALGATAGSAHAITGPFTWKGYTWTPTTGGMAGVCNGDPGNVSIDSNGYLHLKIVKNGTTWSASEVFTSEKMGFGTYQWQIAGPIDRMDPSVVLGLFPYGPQANIGQDGQNEIDSEFSAWNNTAGNINADWTIYGPNLLPQMAPQWEDDFLFSLNGGSATTSRIDWTSTGIVGTIMSGFQPIGATQSVLASKSYMPGSSEIPQGAFPLGMNLWCFQAPPASGQDVEIVIQDFQFIPDGQPIPDAGAQGGPDAGEGDSASADDAAEDSSATSSPDGAMASSGSSSGGSSSGSATGGSGSGSGGGDDASTGSGSSSSSGSSNSLGDTSSGTSSGCACTAAGARSFELSPLFAAVGLALLGARRRADRR
jgi:MYXO-CTERM domain-containing protein